MCKNGFWVFFSENRVVISDKDGNVVTCSERGSLYVPNGVMLKRALFASPEIWQARFGHSSPKKILQMSSINVAENLQTGTKTVPNVCEVCFISGQTRSHITKTSGFCATRTLHYVHLDVCRPIDTVPENGARYLATFIDQFSK